MNLINDLDIAIRTLMSWSSTLNPWYCLLALLVVLTLETSLLVGLLVPGEAALLLTATALGVRWALPIFAFAVCANALGQTGGYWLGRACGPGLRRTWAGRKIGEPRWRAAEEILRGKGGRALITTRFIAVVHAVTPAVVGSLRMPFPRFIGLATIGATLWAAVLTGVALALGETARLVGYGWMALLLTVVASTGTALPLLRSARARSRATSRPEKTASSGGTPGSAVSTAESTAATTAAENAQR